MRINYLIENSFFPGKMLFYENSHEYFAFFGFDWSDMDPLCRKRSIVLLNLHFKMNCDSKTRML